MHGTSRPTGDPGRAKGSMVTPARFYHLSDTVLKVADQLLRPRDIQVQSQQDSR
jgi:hypothetical protein